MAPREKRSSANLTLLPAAPTEAPATTPRALACARCDGPLRDGQIVCALCQLASRIAVLEAKGALVGPRDIERVRARLAPSKGRDT